MPKGCPLDFALEHDGSQVPPIPPLSPYKPPRKTSEYNLAHFQEMFTLAESVCKTKRFNNHILLKLRLVQMELCFKFYSIALSSLQ